VARARLRELLGSRLGVAPERVVLETGANGKPELGLPYATSGLRFNLSHADGLAAYVFTQERRVGIDIERVRSLPDADGVAARVLDRDELREYAALAERDKPTGLFNAWTRKEAFAKATGEGLGFDFQRLRVSLAPDALPQIVHWGATDGERCAWQLSSFTPAIGFVGAVVTESAGGPVAVRFSNDPA
jgi:4'-phosphopantetheinyl transferase